MSDDTMNPIFDEQPCPSCARKDAALRHTLEKIRWVLKNEMYGHQITAALDVIEQALAEAAPTAGETKRSIQAEADDAQYICELESLLESAIDELDAYMVPLPIVLARWADRDPAPEPQREWCSECGKPWPCPGSKSLNSASHFRVAEPQREEE